MKNTIPLVIATCLIPLLINACSSNSGYSQWNSSSPGSSSAANPYGVPTAGGEPGSYPPAPSSAQNGPYEPLPPRNQAAAPVSPAVTPTIPSTPPPAPLASSTTHTVVAGDSLWGIARKYNTSVEAIQSANQLSDTLIRVGDTLSIPGN